MKSTTRLALSVGAALVLLVVVMSLGDVSVRDLASTWREISWPAASIALGVYVVLHLLRTLRFWILIPPDVRPSYGSLVFVCAAYTMANILLPAKLGEATFVVYLKTVSAVPAPQGLAALVVSRLLDLATLSLGFSLACLSLGIAGAYPEIHWFLPVSGILAAGAIAFFILSVRIDLLLALAARLSRILHIDRLPVVGKAFDLLERAALAAREAGGKKRLVLSSGISLGMWACIFLFCAVLALDLGLPPETTLAGAVFGVSVAILTTLLPISAFASFGTMETGWVLGFHLLGVNARVAALTGFGVHVVQLVIVIAFGVLGHIGMGLLPRRSETQLDR